MRNLIYQYFLPYENSNSTMPEWAIIGANSAKKYADTIGAEYEFYDKPYLNATISVFESLRVIFDPYFDDFDNVLILDIDMIVNTKENIFDIEVGDVGMVHELGVTKRKSIPGVSFDDSFWNNYFYHPSKGVITYASKKIPGFRWKKSKMYPKEKFALYNGGLQLWSKEGRLKARELFPRKGHDNFRRDTGKTETPYLNMMLMGHNFDITDIPNEWNRLNYQWEEDGNLGKITHYNDISKEKMLSHGK